jgi:hypothetical protein
VREVDIVIEFGCGPYFSGFDPPMFRRCKINEIWFLAVLEVELDVLKECGLVLFNGEVIVCLTLLNQVVGDMALGQEGIGGDILALDIDGIKEGDSRFDLVSAFEIFSPFYREGPHFF